MSRERVSLGRPPDDPNRLRNGPTAPLAVTLYRICRTEHATPWYFSGDGAGRFDTAGVEGFGTCYAASSVVGAIREVLGPDYSAGDVVSIAWFEDRIAWCLIGADDDSHGPIADLLRSEWSGLQLTEEIWTIDDYDLPQEWACCFLAAGYSGLAHGLRHLPGASSIGYSVFGAEGAQDRDERFPVIERIPLGAGARADFSAATSILVEGAPTPTLGLNVIR